MGGEVVRARYGRSRVLSANRNAALANAAIAVDVVRGLLALYPFRTLYVADLDAIQRDGDNFARVAPHSRGVSVIATCGSTPAPRTPTRLDALIRADLGAPVIGSELQRDVALIARHEASTRVVLSLDFRGDAFQGPEDILLEPRRWPRRVIVMTLARVGSADGPDLARLAAIRSIAEGRELYAAGGVRDAADLADLKAAGAAGALVATALHDGRLARTDLEAI